ncbi:MAG: M13 family metallopeptidase [Eubacteriales bacterium]|nr:M13 family metallopeptidase [Eubacteriales bacterium]
MKHKRMIAKKLVSGLVVCLLVCSGCSNEVYDTTEEKDIACIRYNIAPQDDFYGYVNQEKLLSIDVTNYKMDAGAFEVATKEVENNVKEMLVRIVNSNQKYEYGSKEDILQKGYQQYIKYYENSQEGKHYREEEKKKILAEIHEIEKCNNTRELLAKLNHITADYSLYDEGNLFHLEVEQNKFDANEYCIFLQPIRQIFQTSFEDIYKWENNVSGIQDGEKACQIIAGKSDEAAEKVVKELAKLAVSITWGSNIDSIKAIDLNERILYQEFVSYDELDQILTNVNYRTIEKINGITKSPYGGWYVQDRKQLETLNKIFVDENIEALKAWVLGEFILGNGECLVEDNVSLNKYFGSSKKSLENQGLEYLMYSPLFEDEISALYVENAYSEELDMELRAMCDEICVGYRNKIENASWLGEASRNKLIRKLENINIVTGSNVDIKQINVSKAKCLEGDYISNMKKIKEYVLLKRNSEIGEFPNRTKPSMSMATVNACYSCNNTITIPAAIMIAPLYDEKEGHYYNLGAIGSIIAHEIGHAFDSTCITFNEYGAYDKDWLSKNDMEQLNENNKQAIKYFENAFPVFDIYYVDGELTLAENYADLSGMEVLTSLCKTKENKRELLESYGSLWGSIASNTSIVEQLKNDCHSPSVIRVNSIVATLDAFYDAYDVEKSDAMYIEPEKRIRRWE